MMKHNDPYARQSRIAIEQLLQFDDQDNMHEDQTSSLADPWKNLKSDKQNIEATIVKNTIKSKDENQIKLSKDYSQSFSQSKLKGPIKSSLNVFDCANQESSSNGFSKANLKHFNKESANKQDLEGWSDFERKTKISVTKKPGSGLIALEDLTTIEKDVYKNEIRKQKSSINLNNKARPQSFMKYGQDKIYRYKPDIQASTQQLSATNNEMEQFDIDQFNRENKQNYSHFYMQQTNLTKYQKDKVKISVLNQNDRKKIKTANTGSTAKLNQRDFYRQYNKKSNEFYFKEELPKFFSYNQAENCYQEAGPNGKKIDVMAMSSLLESHRKKFYDYGKKYKKDGEVENFGNEDGNLLVGRKSIDMDKAELEKHVDGNAKYSTIRNMKSCSNLQKVSNGSAFNNYMKHLYQKNYPNQSKVLSKTKPATSVEFQRMNKNNTDSIDDHNEINILQQSNPYLQSTVNITCNNKEDFQDDGIKKKPLTSFDKRSFQHLVKSKPQIAFSEHGKIVFTPSSCADLNPNLKNFSNKHDENNNTVQIYKTPSTNIFSTFGNQEAKLFTKSYLNHTQKSNRPTARKTQNIEYGFLIDKASTDFTNSLNKVKHEAETKKIHIISKDQNSKNQYYINEKYSKGLQNDFQYNVEKVSDGPCNVPLNRKECLRNSKNENYSNYKEMFDLKDFEKLEMRNKFPFGQPISQQTSPKFSREPLFNNSKREPGSEKNKSRKNIKLKNEIFSDIHLNNTNNNSVSVANKSIENLETKNIIKNKIKHFNLNAFNRMNNIDLKNSEDFDKKGKVKPNSKNTLKNLPVNKSCEYKINMAKTNSKFKGSQHSTNPSHEFIKICKIKDQNNYILKIN